MKSSKSGKTRHLNIYVVLGKMKIQEASEDFTEEGILFTSSKTSYIEENT